MDDVRRLPDLAGRALGGSVVHTNDETFAEAHNLITPGPAMHDPTTFGIRGKLYDGWETRRRREPGEDIAIIRLAAPGIVRAVDVDTAFFTGNYPPHVSVHALALPGYPSAAELLAADWYPLVERAAMQGDTSNLIPVETSTLATHLRLTQHPDGGIARFRAHGTVVPDPRALGGRVDLAATLHGGSILDCSNMFYSSPANVLSPGIARVMSDGWETSRRRDDANDWLVVALAAPGILHDAVIDTSRFVGNAPGWVTLTDADSGAILLPRTRLQPDTEHRFRLATAGPVSRVRLDIHPDGGLSRLRLRGTVDEAARADVIAQWLAAGGSNEPEAFFA